MASSFFASWWTKVGPYYTKATPDIFWGIGIMSFLYYKLSFGGKKKAVEPKPGH